MPLRSIEYCRFYIFILGIYLRKNFLLIKVTDTSISRVTAIISLSSVNYIFAFK